MGCPVAADREIVRDVVVDGTCESGSTVVMAMDFTTPLTVATRVEAEVLILGPRDLHGIGVRRWRENDALVRLHHSLAVILMVQVDSER